jgi:hypothetical protein
MGYRPFIECPLQDREYGVDEIVDYAVIHYLVSVSVVL